MKINDVTTQNINSPKVSLCIHQITRKLCSWLTGKLRHPTFWLKDSTYSTISYIVLGLYSFVLKNLYAALSAVHISLFSIKLGCNEVFIRAASWSSLTASKDTRHSFTACIWGPSFLLFLMTHSQMRKRPMISSRKMTQIPIPIPTMVPMVTDCVLLVDEGVWTKGYRKCVAN